MTLSALTQDFLEQITEETGVKHPGVVSAALESLRNDDIALDKGYTPVEIEIMVRELESA